MKRIMHCGSSRWRWGSPARAFRIRRLRNWRLVPGISVLSLFVVFSIPASAGYAVAPRISVGGDAVTLAELVPGAPAEWAKVALGPAPLPGRERTLNRDWILRRAHQVDAQDRIDVPDKVVLVRPGQEVGREAVVREVERALTPRLGPGERIRVLSVGLPASLPAGDLELRVRLPEAAVPSPVTVWVDVFTDGKRRGQAWVRAEMYRARPLVVLTRDVRRGDVIGPEDVEVRSTGPSRGGLSDPAQAVGKRLVRSLRENSPVSARDLELIPVVGRGDVVRLVARVGGVVASIPGRALESGGVGEMILVKSLSSGQSVSGILRDGGVVDVMAGYGR